MPTTSDVTRNQTPSCGEVAELGFRLRTVNAGVLVTLAMVAAIVTYAALTPASPHRPALIAVALGGALCAAAVRGLPHRRLMVAGRHDVLLGAWNVCNVALAAICAILDGGPTSPYVLILFVSVAFAAASLPRRAVAMIACLNLAALMIVASVSGHWPAVLVMWAVALCVVAAVGTLIAGERWQRGLAVQSAQHELLERLARMVEYRDGDTGGHVVQMSEYASIIAAQLGWTSRAAAELRVAAAMHDVGKISIPDHILRKPGPLTADERAVMETHTLVGHQMLSGSENPLIQRAAEIALTHHERWDGSGYPQGLRGEQIPLAGRIVAVADVFDALTSDRVYRRALPVSEAQRIIEDGRGTHFDPDVVDAFMTCLPQVAGARREDPRRAASRRQPALLAPIGALGEDASRR